MLNENVEKIISKVEEKHSSGGVPVNQMTQTPVTINTILEAIKDIGETRDWIMKAILAVYVSTFLEKENPVWLMIVGNPSSNKTTLVDLLKNCPDVFRLDTMTANPFSSGQKETKKDKAKDLLPLLDGKCFIIKEYGTLFGRSDEMVKQLISDLVAIYDGEYSKHSPTRGTIRYESLFSHIGCVTPMALNSRQKYMNSVGARFLFLRVPTLSEEERTKNLEQIWDEGEKKTKAEIADLLASLCFQLKENIKDRKVLFSKESQEKLNKFANLIARARGIVLTEASSFETDEGKKKTHYEVVDIQIEEPFRALKQIRKLARCLALISGKDEVTDEEIEIVRKIVLSSMTVRRADILRVFENGKVFTAKQASKALKKNYRTVKRNFDEMVALGILERIDRENQKAHEYKLNKEFEPIFEVSDIADAEYVQSIFNDNQDEDDEE